MITPADATPCGAIETREHAKLCAELFKRHADEIDGVIIVLPNFGDELGIVQTLDMADRFPIYPGILRRLYEQERGAYE